MPPLILLVITRFGIPVSTTFLVLTLFALSGGAATSGVLTSMLVKSAMGYIVAFGVGILIWVVISHTFERWVFHTREELPWPYWVIFQWITTAFLWSQWLMQDLANIFIFLPRETERPLILRYDPNLDPILRIGLRAPEGKQATDPEAVVEEQVYLRWLAEHRIKRELEAKEAGGDRFVHKHPGPGSSNVSGTQPG